MISVVIPTRHRNESLARCLQRLSPGMQTLSAERYKVIVTDDGSDTTSEAMVREQFPWVRWTAGPRRGPAANRNHGVKHTYSDWIAFTDDDCLPQPGWLSAFVQARFMNALVFEGKTTCEAGLGRFAFDAPVNLSGGLLPSCNMMIERQLYERVGGFDEAFPHAMEDVDLRERLIAAGHAFPFVADAIVDHPPRPRYVGIAAGKHWESRVYFCKKWGQRTSFALWLPIFICKVRLSQMSQEYPKRDMPAALTSLACELFYVATHIRQWDKKHSLKSAHFGSDSYSQPAFGKNI